MEVKGDHKKNTWLFIILIAAVVISFLAFLLFKGEKIDHEVLKERLFCDLEKVNGDFFEGDNGATFTKAICRSNETSLSGEYSCKCTPESKYGISLKLPNLIPGEKVVSKIWMKTTNASGALVFHSVKNDLYSSSSEKRKSKGEWGLLSDTIVIPEGYKEDEALVYAYQTSSDGELFLDDFIVEIFSPFEGETTKLVYEGETLEIQINQENFSKIRKKRDEAMERGLLFASKDDLVDGDIRIDKKEIGARLRLKGDLLDHLRDDAWSYRIELKGKETWKGMSTFSVHNSQARSHLAEWVMHELFRREGIITPAYDFIEVDFNGKNLGVYAYEQHFDNALLINNQKTIAPILRHSDDGYWENVQRGVEPFHWTKVSQIELFNKENKHAEFLESYHQGKALLKGFLDHKLSVAEVFDIDKLAKFYALLELSHALHAQQFTNIRFYYNPMIGKLEPIGFDCFGDHLPNVTHGWTASGESMNSKLTPIEGYPFGGVYKYWLFQDHDFFKAYMQQLQKYTDPSFIDSVKVELVDEIMKRENFIKRDKKYRNYEFSYEGLMKKAGYTHKKLMPLSNYSLQVYTQADSREKLKLQNFHYFPMEVLGFGEEYLTDTLTKALFLEAYNNKTKLETYAIDNPKGFKKIFYQTLGIDSIFTKEIRKNDFPDSKLANIETSIDDLEAFPFIKRNGKNITILSGEHEVDRAIVIPKSHHLDIAAGSTLNFKGTGCLISFSPIRAVGSIRQPIRFVGNGAGHSVLLSNSPAKSIFKNCQFVGLGELKYAGLLSDGGFSIYDSKVDMENIDFVEMTGKNALNLINAQATLDKMTIKNCQGSALNSFMSFAELEMFTADHIGQSALAIGGGKIQGRKINISDAAESAIRVDHKSDAHLTDLNIADGLNGIKAQNGSKITINGLRLKKMSKGIEVTSDEEHKTQAVCNNVAFDNVDYEYIVSPEAILVINGSRKKPK